MFQYDVSDLRQYDTRSDLKDAFHSFLLSIHKTKEEFPFEYENPTQYKGKRPTFRIVGFGGYMSESGWRVYFTYRSTGINHVVQHSWRWDVEADGAVDYRRNEFVG